MTSEEINELRQKGQKAQNLGNFDEAIAHQVQVVNAVRESDRKQYPQDAKLLALYLFTKNDFAASLKVLETLLDDHDDDANLHENCGVLYRKLNRIEDSIKSLERSAELDAKKANTFDALAHSYYQVGKKDKAVEAGNRSLELKDEESCALQKALPIPKAKKKIKPFDYEGNNVIAFSLWGTNPRYLNGAMRNALLIPDMYPGWKARIYHDDSITPEAVDQLKRAGCQMVKMGAPKNFFDGLFWRFLAACDPKVDRFLIRDIDSVVNVKERVAVDEWLASDKHFHLMRDFYSHTELILAGMWGGVGGIFPELNDLLKLFKPKVRPTSTYDQLFLRIVVWPTIKQSLLAHDSVFTALGSKPFPPYGGLPDTSHIGCNEHATRRHQLHPSQLLVQPDKAATA